MGEQGCLRNPGGGHSGQQFCVPGPAPLNQTISLVPLFPSLGLDSIFGFRKSDLSRLKLSALGSVGSPGRRGVAASWNWGTELGSWPEIGSG